MFKYVIDICSLAKRITIDDYITNSRHVFSLVDCHRDTNTLRHRIYPLDDDCPQIVIPMYTTDVDPLGDDCPYDIHKFDSFASGLKKRFGRRK